MLLGIFSFCVQNKPSTRNTQSMLFVLRLDTDEGKLKESKEHCIMIQKLTCLMERWQLSINFGSFFMILLMQLLAAMLYRYLNTTLLKELKIIYFQVQFSLMD